MVYKARRTFKKYKRGGRKAKYSRFKRRMRGYKKSNSMGTVLTYRKNQTFPDIYRAKLMYTDSYSTANLGDPVAGQWSYVNYRGSPRDPELSLGLGQRHAVYYAPLAGLYRNYRVLGVSIKVECSSISDIQRSGHVVIWPYQLAGEPVTVAGVDPEVVAQYPYAVSKYFDSASKTAVLKTYMTHNKLYGVSKAALRVDEGFSAVVDQDIAKDIAFAVGLRNENDGQPTKFRVKVVMKYYVEFYNRRHLGVNYTVGPGGVGGIGADNAPPEFVDDINVDTTPDEPDE